MRNGGIVRVQSDDLHRNARLIRLRREVREIIPILNHVVRVRPRNVDEVGPGEVMEVEIRRAIEMLDRHGHRIRWCGRLLG